MRRRAGVRIGLLVAGATLLCAAIAFALQTATWTPATGWIDNTGKTGTFTSTEMGTMKFYLRARKVGDPAARKYFAETLNGTPNWTGDLRVALEARGMAPQEGERWEITVSQAFKGTDGVERDSPESSAAIYQFPFGPARIPVAPGAPTINEG